MTGVLGLPYYVALLSAAELHGAAHQRPQTWHHPIAPSTWAEWSKALQEKNASGFW